MSNAENTGKSEPDPGLSALKRLAEYESEEIAATGDEHELEASGKTALPGSKKDVAKMARFLMAEEYSSPFPHPDNLRQFGEIVPNGAERAFALTENEQKHRHGCQDKALDAQIKSVESVDNDRRLIIIICAIFAFASLAATVVLLALGMNLGAGLVGGGTLLGALVAGFFGFRKKPESGQK